MAMFLILEERLVSESTGGSLDLNPIQEVSSIMKMNCESYPNNKKLLYESYRP